MRAPWLVALSLLWAWLTPGLAEAHAVGLSRGQYRALSDGLEAELVFARLELGPRADAAEHIVQRIRVSDAAGRSCPGELVSAQPSDTTSSTLVARYRCNGPTPTLHVELQFWDELSPGHRHLVSRTEAAAALPAPALELCQREQPRFVLAGTSSAGAHAATAEPGFSGWVRLGIEHILGGYDHLAFLLALVLVARTLRSLAATVSVFTLAHSLTLALAALGAVAPPSWLVECAIALSICYVGTENLTARATNSRRSLVFGFGLIHGFGFAGALREVGLGAAQTPFALLGFNLGVELGQLGLLACAFPLVLWLRQRHWFTSLGVPALSAAIALAGAIWFAGRLPSTSWLVAGRTPVGRAVTEASAAF
jgi:hydrogenase/urease accessory protein HupE